MNVSQQELTTTAFALLCASIGCIHDIRTRRIPNRLSGFAALCGVALHSALGGWPGIFDSMLAGLCAGAIALIFWLAGGMGAGDVKLLAAVGCITGCVPLRTVMISTAVAGGLLALATSTYQGRLRETLHNVALLVAHHQHKGLKPHPELNLKSVNARSLPFALPIAAGCLVTLCNVIWEVRS